ncbi:MAG TPA: GntR family transcriptional regulator [Chloroflexota bacterium]|nr:GntR family transcriptional regulator [Chloroflexota bacterium]
MSATEDGHRLHALPRERLIDRAVEAIREHILANRLSGGDRLPSESELARSLGVSRNVVRQAVSSLEALGVVQVAHGRGIYVGTLADTNVFRQLANWINASELDNPEYLEVRAIFERGIYEILIERVTDAELDRFADLATAMRDATDAAEIHRLHDEFHDAVLAATDNRFLATMGTILNRFFWSVASTSPHVHLVSDAEMQGSHLRIVDLLRRRNRNDIPRVIALHLGINANGIRGE